MTLFKLYEFVSRQTEMTQERFLDFYRQTVAELLGEYESKYVLRSSDSVDLNGELDMYSDPLCFAEYDAAITSNILYLNDSALTTAKEISVTERVSAFRRVWKRKNRKRACLARFW